MYAIRVEASFTAAHRHRLADGGRGLHGHDFLVLAQLEGRELGDDVLVDFHQVEGELRTILAGLGHQDLNQHPALAGREPVPAVLARYIFERLEPRVGIPGRVSLRSVEVRDGDRSGALYAPPTPREPAAAGDWPAARDAAPPGARG